MNLTYMPDQRILPRRGCFKKVTNHRLITEIVCQGFLRSWSAGFSANEQVFPWPVGSSKASASICDELASNSRGHVCHSLKELIVWLRVWHRELLRWCMSFGFIPYGECTLARPWRSARAIFRIDFAPWWQWILYRVSLNLLDLQERLPSLL